MNTKCFLFAGTALSAAALTTQAAVVASYAFNNPANTNRTYAQVGTNTSDYFAADVEDANVNAENFVFGAGLSGGLLASFGSMYVAEGTGPLADGINNNMAGAVTANQYLGFTVTADPGYTLNLSSLEFGVGRLANGAQDYAVRSDVDNFADDIVFGDDAIPEYGSFNGATTLAQQTISLAGADYQNLQSIELRIYFDDRADNNGATSGTNIDNVVLNGTAAIPEPGSFALIAGALALCSVMLRRRA